MIPNHILNDLQPDDRVAILSRGGEIHFFIHPVSDAPSSIEEYAEREGSRVLRSHMRDQDEILKFVDGREQDVGGEA
jgi:hypothetical protein